MPIRCLPPTLIAAALVLAGCQTITPAPLTDEALVAQTRDDRAAVRRGVPPIGETLTLDEAIARALKFNLDRRARQFEEAMALHALQESGHDRLPRLVAAAGYTARDKDRIATSIDSVTGLPSLANPAISSERSRMLSSLQLSWSLLDYGLATYAQQQAADRAAAAAERRRKATHLLVQDVRAAYWRAASAQRLREDVRTALALADEALADSRRAEEERLRSPLDTLRYQRQLTENMRLLEAIEQELATARFELAALVNAPIAQEMRLVSDEAPSRRDPLDTPVADMEDLALARNADLREHIHQRRIAAVEARKVLARAYPNLTLTLGRFHDSDSFLLNPAWAEAGASVSLNLFNLLALPAQRRTADAAIALADQRRLAVHAAVVAQVHVARQQLSGARRQFERSDVLWRLDTQILDQTMRREEARAGSKLDRVAAQTTAIVSRLRRDQALAHWHASVGRLQATLGVDPLPESTDDLDLPAIGRLVRDRLLDA